MFDVLSTWKTNKMLKAFFLQKNEVLISGKNFVKQSEIIVFGKYILNIQSYTYI